MCLKFIPNGFTQKRSSMLGVANGDVTGDAFVEAELAEEPERRRQPLLAVQALGLDGIELRRGREVAQESGHDVEFMPRSEPRVPPIIAARSDADTSANCRAMSSRLPPYVPSAWG